MFIKTRGLLGISTAILFFGFGLMPASADRAFDRWVDDFWPQAKKAGISHSTYQRAFRGVSPDPEVIEKSKKQPEFVKPIWEYLDGAVSDKRIENGREKLSEYRGLLDRIEQRYGVDRHIVVAIWGMESSYGFVLENPKVVKPVIQSLATLAYSGGRLSKFGRTQLIGALKILERGDVTADRMTGSWAGAMGHTQFIPTTYNAYAVDFDGDGKRNIWSSIGDALGSTAAYLNKAGWDTGKTWGYEVELQRGFDYALADERTKRSLADWERLGVGRSGGRGFPRPRDMAVLFTPFGARGPAFLMLDNFKTIKRYNNANAYALAVGHLADRLRGGSDFEAGWVRDDRQLSSSETKELQQHLTAIGLSTGGADGRVGPKTRSAILAYQARIGVVPDGMPALSLLERLRKGR